MNPFRHLGRTPCRAFTYIGQHNTEKRGQTYMPRAEFETIIPVFEGYNTIRFLDCTGTGAGF